MTLYYVAFFTITIGVRLLRTPTAWTSVIFKMAESGEKVLPPSDELEWVPAPSPQFLDTITFQEKFKSKISANPFVPLGLVATVSFLVMGLNSMRTGRSARSQLMMRGRVVAQGFTIVAILVGIWMGAASRKKQQ